MSPGVFPYKSHMGIYRPKTGMAFAPFRSGTDVDFAHFCLESGMVYEGYGSVWTYLSFQFQMNKKERGIC